MERDAFHRQLDDGIVLQRAARTAISASTASGGASGSANEGTRAAHVPYDGRKIGRTIHQWILVSSRLLWPCVVTRLEKVYVALQMLVFKCSISKI